MDVRIYHNPRCSKSRATLALLQDRGIPVEIVEYIQHPPSAAEIREILRLLGMDAADLVRKGEAAFRDSGLDASAPEQDLVELMAREPVVIERPIVVADGKARIGRPPERVLELFA